jgi:hypothetical protein
MLHPYFCGFEDLWPEATVGMNPDRPLQNGVSGLDLPTACQTGSQRFWLAAELCGG